ncbi:hypothetical protein AB6A40_003753 [Gnathostoma spinigerum]|uniref:Tudor domain-containing protein n=1 Tax=Gnathostoma spinigerum TaxID=75299 RepID=A0ABD6EI78_9BILA
MNRRRDLSPIFESDLDNNKGHDVPVMITNGLKADGFLKIHRLCMSRKATMTLLSLTSPSRIWLTLRNNITDSLRITEPSAIEPLDPKFVRIDQYVMAPLRNRLYARARIMDVYESVERQEKYVKVFFIDDGLSSWLGAKCLAKMDEEFSFHPWQALGVSLFQVDPINPVNLTTRKEWNDHEIGTLRSIMREYDEFLVNFVHESRLRTDYSDFYKVKIIGLTDEEQNGVSVNELFYLFNPATVSFTRARYDGSKQKMYAPVRWSS